MLHPIYLDDATSPEPIILASEAELFQSLHLQMCAETGADSAYISVRRVVDWLNTRKARAANA